MRLSLELVERAGTHPHGQRRVGVRREPGVIRTGRLEEVHGPTLSLTCSRLRAEGRLDLDFRRRAHRWIPGSDR